MRSSTGRILIWVKCAYDWAQTAAYNTAWNSSDNLPSYPSDNHHSSDDVCWSEWAY